MKLVDIETGEVVVLPEDQLMTIKTGVNEGQSFYLDDIVPPNEQWPNGLLKSKPDSRGGWQKYEPWVLGVRIDDTP